MQSYLQNNLIQHYTHNALQLRTALSAVVYSSSPAGVTSLVRTTPSNLRHLSFFLRNTVTRQLRSLVDISAVDRLRFSGRFSLNYLYLSISTNQRLNTQLTVKETTTVPSLAVPFTGKKQRLHAATNWLEREV